VFALVNGINEYGVGSASEGSELVLHTRVSVCVYLASPQQAAPIAYNPPSIDRTSSTTSSE
jgi:hypothetical protein